MAVGLSKRQKNNFETVTDYTWKYSKPLFFTETDQVNEVTGEPALFKYTPLNVLSPT